MAVITVWLNVSKTSQKNLVTHKHTQNDQKTCKQKTKIIFLTCKGGRESPKREKFDEQVQGLKWWSRKFPLGGPRFKSLLLYFEN